MKILVLGGSGMLGHMLFRVLSTQFDVVATVRDAGDDVSRYPFYDPCRFLAGVDVNDHNKVRELLDEVRPDAVVNCVGVIKQLDAGKDVVQTLPVNSVFPHVLAGYSDKMRFRLITISTDCVFSGLRGRYTEDDVPDARDLYGLSKYLGEVNTQNTLTLRTSILGRELNSANSFVEWFLSNRGGRVKGFRNVIYTGFPTIIFAELISLILTGFPDMRGVWHVGSDAISKYEILRMLNKAFQVGAEIEPVDEPHFDRSLDSTRFRNATGFTPLPWPEMIQRMASDPLDYDRFRSQSEL